MFLLPLQRRSGKKMKLDDGIGPVPDDARLKMESAARPHPIIKAIDVPSDPGFSQINPAAGLLLNT